MNRPHQTKEMERMTAVSMDSVRVRRFEQALGYLINNALESEAISFDELRVVLAHELEDMTFDECEECGGEGTYFVCIDQECDPDGCERECACQ